MEISLPALKHSSKIDQGFIVKIITRKEIVDSEISILRINNNHGFTFRRKGQDVLVLKSRDDRMIKKYECVLISTNNEEPDLSAKTINLATYKWLRHPLLEKSYLDKHNPKYVLDSWKNAFTYKSDSPDSPGLRTPQIGALHAIEAHWCVSDEPAVIVLPTGTGKTETMLGSLISNEINKLLLIVPTDALRDQLTGKFATLGILPDFQIVTEECENPIVGVVKHGFKNETDVNNFFDQINVAVATMNVLSGCSAEMQYYISKKVTHLFIDEAHHTPAKTWKSFKKRFSEVRVLLFTATPFRNDGKRLDGKIIFNFPLKRAQELEYFKPIKFKPIVEYDRKLADQQIAELAIATLKEDLSNGYNHILMVRVNKIGRAEEIKEYYDKYPEFNAVLVHSQIKPNKDLKDLIQAIVEKKHRVIICVDMLGEGFDLPELKIAAFHDTKKSLAITLQLAGRFTRVKTDLGPATFIANIAEPDVTEDLENLYYKDSDWNILLPDLSFKMSLEQEDFRTFLEGFKGFPNKFPIQAIKHPLSTIIFRTETKSWKPLNYPEGIRSVDSYEFVYSDYNEEQEVLILILGQKSFVKWAKIEDFTSMNWDIIICYFDKKTKLLYIHSSNTNSYFEKFAHAISPNSILLKGQNIFRCFSGINRLRLHNVGVREPMGRAMNYIMRVGSDIKTALKQTEINKAIKSNIFGVGFEYGSRNSIGCSHNGRIWSMRTNNIPTWIKWCKSVAAKITDETIDPSLVLKGTLLPVETLTIPDCVAFSIEWPDFIYRELIGVLLIKYKNNEEYPISNCDLSIVSQATNSISFNLETPGSIHLIKLILYSDGERMDYKFECDPTISVDGIKLTPLADFMYKNPPLIYFTDGSFLEGNLHTEITYVVPEFMKSNVIGLDWKSTDIKKESQTYLKLNDSIQFYMLEKLKAEKKYEIIMDDDDKGEIADIVAFAIDKSNNILNIDLYHCKYAVGGTIGSRIDNFYAVCSQAQKSIKWMENTDMIFKQLARRSNHRQKMKGVDRFEKGDNDLLDLYKRRAKKDLKVRMNIFIVQPGLSYSSYTEKGDISKLLAAVEGYLKETWNASLIVYANNN